MMLSQIARHTQRNHHIVVATHLHFLKRPSHATRSLNCVLSQSRKQCIRTHSSSSGSNKFLKPPSANPPSINPNPKKPNILQEKAQKAAQVHAELQTLLEKQEARRELERQTPFLTKFISFIKSSKSEMINIGAAFCCVLLAFQMVNARKIIRAYISEVEDLKKDRDDLRGLLKILVGGDGGFSESVGKLCAEECQKEMESGNMEEGGGWGIFGRRKKGNDAMLDDHATNLKLQKALSVVILQEIQKVIGPDAAFTIDERKERRVAELQRMVEGGTAVHESSSKVENVAVDATNTSGGDGGLGTVLAEFQKADEKSSVEEIKKGGGGGEEKVVKRRKYAI